MNILLQYKQHFDDDCLGKSPVVDKIERFRNESGFMKTIFEERIYNPRPSLDRNKNKSLNVERKQIILSRKEQLMIINKNSGHNGITTVEEADEEYDARFYDEDEELLEFEKQIFEEQEEYEDRICYEDYLNSLWKEWCKQREEESKKNREALLTKYNTDDNSVDTTYATESTDSTSVKVIQLGNV